MAYHGLNLSRISVSSPWPCPRPVWWHAIGNTCLGPQCQPTALHRIAGLRVGSAFVTMGALWTKDAEILWLFDSIRYVAGSHYSLKQPRYAVWFMSWVMGGDFSHCEVTLGVEHCQRSKWGDDYTNSCDHYLSCTAKEEKWTTSKLGVIPVIPYLSADHRVHTSGYGLTDSSFHQGTWQSSKTEIIRG